MAKIGCQKCTWEGDSGKRYSPNNLRCENSLTGLHHIIWKEFPGLQEFIDRDAVPQKPKMLFVDDRSKRLHFAMDYYSDKFDVIIAANVPEVLRLLSTHDWDVVSLDCDLAGNDFENPDTTIHGMEIVRYLKKCGGWPFPNSNSLARPQPEFWVHSSNIFAANIMLFELRNLGFVTHYRSVSKLKEYKTYEKV